MGHDTARFLLRPCWLGWILLAASPRGIVAISLGDQPDRLTEELHQRHPEAQLAAADPELGGWLDRVLAAIDEPASPSPQQPPPPLDLGGTPFRRRVWQELVSVPAGHTVSYAELARRLGEPSSVRAVAQACGANPIALAIPCHRVIGSDGSLRGYRWGIERKQALLEREAGLNGA
ncbi:MAG: methylated-DNA--[protein]-cysteine S-methyltransferase [Cyanobacteria bacterium]|nr:methylated-DNA--[protein]-cysteine S-methyltransferase [Cyanobacteria bacterium bin.51]